MIGLSGGDEWMRHLKERCPQETRPEVASKFFARGVDGMLVSPADTGQKPNCAR